MGSHAPNGHIYLLGRDEGETARLNNQHRFLAEVSGNNLIHPSIPKDQITAVADLGTGTGIWLEDAAKALSHASPVYLHGFDVSSAQFPPGSEIRGTEKHAIQLSIHDVLKPFPPEHRGRYDLVHIRLLTAGLKQGDYTTVVTNARSLLKPNGYLQWEEIDSTCFCTDHLPEHPSITAMRHSICTAMVQLGLWPYAPQRVHDEIATGGFRNVRHETYTTVGKEHLRLTAAKWVAGVMRALVPKSMVVTGEAADKEEAREKVEAMVADFEEHCRSALALVNFSVTVGQKHERPTRWGVCNIL